MHFDPWVDSALSIAVIVAVAAAAQFAVRRGIRAGVRQLLERRAGERELTDAARAGLEQRAVTLQRLAVRVSGGIIVAIAGLMVLDKLGIEIGPALAGLGVVGIAVGFGAQAIFHDWLSGIFIIVENQYSIGDVVKVAGVAGVVEDISLRRTLLRDLNGTLHSVPNGQIGVASNLTSEWAQVNLDVPVAYDTDIPHVTEVLDRIGRELEADPAWAPKLVEPPSVLRVDDLGDSAVSLKILGKVHAGDQWAVTGELRSRILATFRAEGIEIPFPQRVVTTRSLDAVDESTAADSV
jgi:moderate conductance mechanosensitive channel